MELQTRFLAEIWHFEKSFEICYAAILAATLPQTPTFQ
jgi:hypothetical protein